ncbi:uncharacterized protein PFL1_05005 [Pseudozyma flocculosa PF-1]|uniref:Phospholipid/glycerol acyltransferase domain-containing protein n=2 Tax=Pseudozyma flocculosa TaxID=84751 RepID=A0A5C3EV10_9BASI|nr:uncharacterized protein PFL1_05005 [Pseudozyma flocculosa PF-1]EPQ27467.1 hypothetical protein PFL1_05005 [Pseudozyma flocculosa PF-1]SPO36103.1 uncharacterized protein PSFLO_01574 [Pseudozyma flocculosa]
MAEKFSRFRDAGTGIQVFLNPVPPASSASSFSYVLLPFSLVFGALRSLLIALFAGIWALANLGAPLGRGNAFFARAILALFGFYSIREEKISLRSRGRATSASSSIVFAPGKGDIIVANSTSWTDLLYLAARFAPVFVLPIVSASSRPPSGASSSATSTPGGATTPRRGTPKKNAMSANTRIETPGAEQATTEIRDVKGFRRAGLWEMIRRTGYTPLVEGSKDAGTPLRLDQIAESAEAPVVVFPELVTSNNRGLLRFSTVFPASWRLVYRRSGALQIGAGQSNLYLLSFKHDPPSNLLSTTTLSVPTHLGPASSGSADETGWNPLRHMWSLVCTLPVPRALTVRLLDPSESPTGRQYVADPASVNVDVLDPLADACAGLVANLSRLRRTNLGWEDKEAFLALMRSRR